MLGSNQCGQVLRGLPRVESSSFRIDEDVIRPPLQQYQPLAAQIGRAPFTEHHRIAKRFIMSYKVGRLIPRSSAALATFPSVPESAASTA